MGIYVNIGDVWKSAVLTGYVTVVADPSGPQQTGTSITFTATPTNLAGISTYQWIKNGSNVGSNQNTYALSSPANGDQVRCDVTSTTTWIGTVKSNTISVIIWGDKGYNAGGVYNNWSTRYSEITYFSFASESGGTLSATLALARYGLEGYFSTTKGYCSRGSIPNSPYSSTEIDGLQFSDETAINPSTAFAAYGCWGFAISYSTKGYIFSGVYSNYTTTIMGFTFSDESLATLSATAPVGLIHSGVCWDSTKGWWGGGRIFEGEINYIDSLTFSSETTTNESITVAHAMTNPFYGQSSTKGYFLGGWHWEHFAGLDVVCGVLFSDGSAFNGAHALTVPYAAGASASSDSKIYLMGGSRNNNLVNSVSSLNFSDETTSLYSVSIGSLRFYSVGLTS